MKHFLVTALLFLSGCSWLAKQDIDLCVDYHGRHICVGRKDGQWQFAADVTPDEQADIIKGLGQ